MAKSLRTATGGRAASNAVIPGRRSLSIGKPNLPEPEGWFWKSLSDVAQLETGHTPSRRKPEYWDGDIPWIGIRDATENHGRTLLDTKQHVTQQGIDNSSARILPRGTVCLSRTASVGYVVQMGVEMATSQDFVNWVCSDQLDPRFLKYLLLSEQEAIRRFATGTTHQTVYFPEAKAFYVLLPPPSEQRAIAHVLGTLDDKIELNRNMNETLEEMARAIFKSWFVDFDPVTAKAEGRQPVGMDAETAALFPDAFEDSELGEIPKGWKPLPLGEIISEVGKKTKLSAETERNPYVPIECISSKSLTLWDYKDGEEAKSSLVTFKKGNILFGAMRPYFHKVCIAPFNGTTRTTCLVLTSKQKDYFSFSLLTLFLKSTIDFATQNSTGSTIPYIKWKNELETLVVAVPPVEMAGGFNDLLVPILEKFVLGIEEQGLLSELRDTLLPRLISGKLRIPDAEKLLAEASV